MPIISLLLYNMFFSSKMSTPMDTTVPCEDQAPAASLPPVSNPGPSTASSTPTPTGSGQLAAGSLLAQNQGR